MNKNMKDPLAIALGRRGGLKGGPARAKKLSPESRKAIARQAAMIRWHGVQPKHEDIRKALDVINKRLEQDKKAKRTLQNIADFIAG